MVSLHATIEPIVALTDSIGVLSIYVDADPSLGAGPRPAWQVPVRAELRRLLKEARSVRPREQWVALEARVAELEPELEALLDPRLGCRGRALFAAVSGHEVHRVELRAPLRSFVALERHACVLPLLAALEHGRPAGVATVSWNRLEAAEWQYDVLRPMEPVTLAEPEERRTRPATNPAVPQPFPERDKFEGAIGARVVSRLRDESARLARHAEAQGWDLLIVDGDPRLVNVLSDSLHTESCRFVRSTRPLAGLPNAEAVERVGSMVRDLRAERHAELAQELDASSTTTRDAALLERSLDEGRVAHLWIEVPTEPSCSPASESLLRRALDTSAEVTAISPGLANLGASGTAAFLRW